MVNSKGETVKVKNLRYLQKLKLKWGGANKEGKT